MLMVAAALALRAQSGIAQPWLVVTSPTRVNEESRVPLYEVHGQAGSRNRRGHDLVIALDLSDSTLASCGVDLDGDGESAGTDPELLAELRRRDALPARLALRLEQRDFDDTILAAELEAAEALIHRLDPNRFRVGLVVFSNEAEVLAAVGTPREELLTALHEIRYVAAKFLRGTNLMAAIDLAGQALAPPERPPPERDLSVVLLTDGVPSLPIRGGPGPRSIAAARSAGMLGIRIYPFAIGAEAHRGRAVIDEMARWTEGVAAAVAHPAEVASELRNLDLVDLREVQIANVTSGEHARAPRTFPDGSFDGLLPLVPGSNRIRVEATHRDGTRHVVERSVLFDPSGAKKPKPELLRERIEALRRRTREIELWAELRDERVRQRKELEIEPLRSDP